jgi:plasmid stabilization system protein ParE
MGHFTVKILGPAQSDVDRIFDWIKDRSPEGAVRWYDAFLAAAETLAVNPEICGLAPEFAGRSPQVQQRLFKTRRGSTYRLLFMIVDQEVHVLRVRGPGQAPLGSGPAVQ